MNKHLKRGIITATGLASIYLGWTTANFTLVSTGIMGCENYNGFDLELKKESMQHNIDKYNSSNIFNKVFFLGNYLACSRELNSLKNTN